MRRLLDPGKVLPIFLDHVPGQYIMDDKSQEGSGRRPPLPELSCKIACVGEKLAMELLVCLGIGETARFQHGFLIREVIHNMDE